MSNKFTIVDLLVGKHRAERIGALDSGSGPLGPQANPLFALALGFLLCRRRALGHDYLQRYLLCSKHYSRNKHNNYIMYINISGSMKI